MKKAIALAGAGLMLLTLASPVFGWPFHQPFIGSDNVAMVENSAMAVADSGANTQSNVADVQMGGSVTVNGAGGNRWMETGGASAYAGALVVANTHVGCGPCVEPHDDDMAAVRNDAQAGAYSGLNGQDDVALVHMGGGVTVDGGEGDRFMSTGDTDSTARAWTIVNTHVSFGGFHPPIF